MKDKELEKTVLMDGTEEKSGLQDTKSIPRVTNTAGPMQQEKMIRRGSVRELAPVRKQEETGPQKAYIKKRKRRKAIFLTAGFLVALLSGFILAGYYHDRQQATENQHMQQAAQIQQQANELTQQRQQLEQEKLELEQKRQALQSAAGHIAGKNTQIEEENQSASMASKLLDKVTGKEKERQRSIQDNAAQETRNNNDAAALNVSINDAQAMINDVDSKLGELDQVRQQANRVKQAAASAYNENANTIGQILYYASEGMDFVRGLLSK
jgi:hypothetical protein